MKPLERFLFSTTFAANNISTAEENSAEANSFKTKQLLSALNFFKFFFGIKNIFYIIFFLILLIQDVNAKKCLSFLPYGFNGSYVHLPQGVSFCIKQGKQSYKYKTDNYGGRLLYDDKLNNQIQVFGDSQVLGLDVEKIEQHYLHKLYKKKNFVIYAAPNNGPYEVINFLNENNKFLKKKIIITFNMSTDLYRISSSWNPKNNVALKDYELDEIIDNPLKYKILIFKNFLLNKNFSTRKYDIKKMQKLFLSLNQEIINDLLNKYIEELDYTANKFDINIDFIITHPYWVYSIDKKKNKLFLEKELNDKVEKLICNTFKKTKKINNIYITKLPTVLELEDLTFDRRHLKSNKINLILNKTLCYN